MAVNKKVTIVALCSVLLVVMVIGIVITHVSNKNDANNASKGNVAQSMKAVKSMCKTTYYQDTCEKNLNSNSNHTTEPKELIKVGFNVALKHINETIAKSTTLKDAATDPRTAGAYRVCEMMLDLAIDDLKRSFKKIDTFDFDVAKIEEHLFDLKVWLSGANTAQGTCLDAFQNTSGDAGEKMKNLLKTSRELTMNGFAMINELSRALTELHITNSAQNRKLLAEGMEVPSEGQYPSWVNEGERRLLKGKRAKKKPNVVVAQDGSGKYKTITEALKDIPIDNKVAFIIHIKAGVYKENFVVEKTMTNVMFVGDGPTKTIITGDRSVKKGFSTIESATVGVLGFHFTAKDIGFENTAAADEGPAVALHITSDQSIFHNCHINGYQDTLYSHDHRQFFRDCKISGTIDFIFGDSIAIFQNCEIVARKPAPKQANAVIAQGREFEDDITGMVIQNCNFVAEPDLLADPKVKTYLGRPWKKYSKAIIMQSYIGEFISPDGWTIWEEASPNTDFGWIAEFENTGPGANVASRVKWPSYKKITKDVATAYTAAVFFRGDEWIVPRGVPYIGGFTTLTTGGMVFNNTNALFRNSANANANTNIMPSNSSANSMTPSNSTNTMSSNSSSNVITPSTSDNVMTPSTSDNGMTSSTSVNAMTPSISANAMTPSTSDNVIIPSTSANAMTPSASDNAMTPIISANVITPSSGANDMTPSTSVNIMPSNDGANSMAPSSITNTLTTTSSTNAPTSNSNSANAMSPSTSAYAMSPSVGVYAMSPSTSGYTMSPSTSGYTMSPSTGANVITPSTSANAMTPSIGANVVTPSTGANDMTPSTSANTIPSNDGANFMTPSSITNTLTTTISANAPTPNSNSANAMSPSTSAYAMSSSTSANVMSPSTSDNAMTPSSSINTMPSNEGAIYITPSSSTNTLTITSSANAPESNSNSANAMSPQSSSNANPTTSISAANTPEASTSNNGKTNSYSNSTIVPNIMTF